MTRAKGERPIVAMVYNSTDHIVKARLPLIAAIERLGYSVAVVSPIDAATPALLDRGVAHYPIEMSQYGMNPLAERRCMRRIETILRRIEPVASLHYTIKPNIFGTLAARRAGVPVISTIAGAGRAFSSGPTLLRMVIELYRRSLRHSSRVFFQNQDDMRMFIDLGLVEPDRCARLPGSGVDLQRYQPAPFPSGPTRFLFLGRLLLEKGIDDYLAAACRLIDARGADRIEFHIAGPHADDRAFIPMDRLLDALQKKSVVYRGAVAPEQVVALIAAADCVVLPSRYGEGVPRVLLEACASGRPIITTDNVGCRDVVEDGVNGFRVPPRDPAALAAAMDRFHRLDDAARRGMSTAARRTVERSFDENIVIQAYLDAISEIARARNFESRISPAPGRVMTP